MGKTVDFEKVRKRRRRVETTKRLLVLCLIATAVAGVVFLNSLFVEQGLSVRVSDMIESFGGEGFPTEQPGGIIRDMKGMGGNLVILNDTNLYIYNKKAKIIKNEQRMTDKTMMLTNAERVLTFDVGSKNYSIHTPSRLTSVELENSILTGDLGKNGEYAFVTSSRQFVAEVTVYKNHGEPYLFRWSSPENYVTGVSLSPKGGAMAVSGLTTEEGVMKSLVTLFQFNRAEKIAEVEFPDSLVLLLNYYEAGRIGVLTDREYTVIGPDGSKLFTYRLGDYPVAGFQTYGREALVLTEYKEARSSDIILLSEDCTERARITVDNNVRGMAMGNKRIYILTDSGISVYDRNLEPMDKLEQRGITKIQLVGDKLYYCNGEEINYL